MQKIKIVLSVIAIALGASLFVYGGYDDSPGAQLIAALVICAGITGIVRSKKQTIF